MAFVWSCAACRQVQQVFFSAGNSGLLAASQISLAPSGLAQLTWDTRFSKQSSAVTHSAQIRPA
jgi:hypothetical protein